MQLISVEASRLVALASLRALRGIPFSLDLLSGVLERYKFQHFPDRVPLPGTNQTVTLKVGQWDGVQIDEFSAYSDGFVVSARAPSHVLEEFIENLYSYLEEVHGIVKVPKPEEARHYESAVVVEMDPRIEVKFSFLDALYRDLGKLSSAHGLGRAEYRFGGFQIDTETSLRAGHNPVPFTVVRRKETAFDDNYWFSSAALRTADHLEALESLEARLLKP